MSDSRSHPNSPLVKKKKTRGFWPPIWLRIILLAILVFTLWMRISDSSGDRGIANVNTMMLGMLVILLSTPWFVFFSGYSRKVRFGLPLLVIVGLVAFFNLFRYQGVSGNMIPGFALGAAPADPALGKARRDAGAAVDLRTTTPDDFPGFLGPRRDGMVPHINLARDWRATPPMEVWRQAIGRGLSAFAVVNGIAVTMEQRGDQEAITAYDVATGELLWANSAPGRFSHLLGGVGPRSTPTISEGRVYALGALGRFVCLDGATGDVIWEKNLLEEYNVTPEQESANVMFGRANSPLVVGDLVIIPAGGNKGGRIASLVAYHKLTGDTVWEAGSRQISFSSPRLAKLAGVDQILIVNEDTLSGHHPGTGAGLWEYPWPGHTPRDGSSSQAVPVPPDRVFVSKGYGGGAALLQLIPAENDPWAVKEVWASHRLLRTKFTQVIIKDGFIYGLSDGILECVDLEAGKRVWKAGRYQHGQILGVGDLLLVLTESGRVVLVEPTPEEANKVLGEFQAVEGQTWNNMALYGDLLLVRNSQEAAVWRLPLAGGR